jgi:GT2 family glycosyltransferase
VSDSRRRPAPPPVSVVIPNWNGQRWLPGCLGSLSAQTLAPHEVIVVDNGSTDGSIAYLRAEHPHTQVLQLERNTGFAHAANHGLAAATGALVALINTDVVLEPDWLERTTAVLRADPEAASVACKMLQLDDPGVIYDAGDVLRRDGACEQRGRFGLDDGRWDLPGDVFGACAGAALYRRDAVTAVGGFDERYFAYLEDVDLALRLRLSGWSCRYEPVVAGHAGAGSSPALTPGLEHMVTRNTMVLIAKAFPLRWLPFVAYRQAAWAVHAFRERRLLAHLQALAAGLAMLPGVLGERRRLRAGARVPMGIVVPSRPFRGPQAGGHLSQRAPERGSGIVSAAAGER